jgi:dimethylamine/trimethylamine dehydrogenase
MPNDALYHEILATAGGDAAKLPFTLTRIGDCEAPAIVAAAVYSGRRYAEEMDAPVDADMPLRHDRPIVTGDTPARTRTRSPSSVSLHEAAEARYLETLLRYYEEEISGDAYFRALAARLPQPERKAQMILMAEVERHAARAVLPLIRQYCLTPRPDAELAAVGIDWADKGPQDWEGMIAYMSDTFPSYVDQFLALEQMAPEADQVFVKMLTQHEVVALEYLGRVANGVADPTEPLVSYLCTPHPEARAA